MTFLSPSSLPDVGSDSSPIYFANSEKVFLSPEDPSVRFPDNSKVNLSAPLIVITDPSDKVNLIASEVNKDFEITKPFMN